MKTHFRAKLFIACHLTDSHHMDISIKGHTNTLDINLIAHTPLYKYREKEEDTSFNSLLHKLLH